MSMITKTTITIEKYKLDKLYFTKRELEELRDEICHWLDECEEQDEVSERDSEAEGIDESGSECIVCGEPYSCAVDGFACLWNSINAKRGYAWDANPWVWVVEFDAAKEVGQ